MEVSIKKDRFEYTGIKYKTTLLTEHLTEAIVPDVQPDILKIIDTKVDVMLRSKEADHGRVTVGGIVNVTVLYTPDGVGLCAMDTGVPYSVSVADSEIVPECDIVAQVTALSADVTLVNSRKIVVRIGLESDISCYCPCVYEISAGLTGEDAEAFEMLTNNESISVLTSINEKRFVISDELSIPEESGLSARAIIKTVDAKCMEYRFAGSKLIIHGSIRYNFLMAAGEQKLTQHVFRSEFSQMIDIGYVPENADCTVIMMPTNIYFEEVDQAAAEKKLVSEVHMVAQCCISGKKDIIVLRDAYSSKFSAYAECTEVSTLEAGTEYSCKMAETVSVTLPETTENVIYSEAIIRKSEVASNEDGKVVVPAVIKIVTRDNEGKINSWTKDISVEVVSDVPVSSSDKITALLDARVSVNGQSAEVSIEGAYGICERNARTIKFAAEIIQRSGEKAVLPSIVIKRISAADDLWELGKQYHSTLAAIKSANGLEDRVPEVGEVLLIPRVRM